MLVGVCRALGWERLPRTLFGLYSIAGLRDCLVLGSKNGAHPPARIGDFQNHPAFYARLVAAAGGRMLPETPIRLVGPPPPRRDPGSVGQAAFLRHAELFVGEANALGGNDDKRHAVLGSYQRLDRPNIFTVVEAGSTKKMVEELAGSFSAMSMSGSLGYQTDTIVVGWSARFEKIDGIDGISQRQIRAANELAKTQPVLLRDTLLKKNVLVLASHLERGEEPRKRGLRQIEVIAEALRDILEVDYCVAAGDYNSKPRFVAAYAPSFVPHVSERALEPGVFPMFLTYSL
jgi:hypothetical protein